MPSINRNSFTYLFDSSWNVWRKKKTNPRQLRSILEIISAEWPEMNIEGTNPNFYSETFIIFRNFGSVGYIFFSANFDWFQVVNFIPNRKWREKKSFLLLIFIASNLWKDATKLFRAQNDKPQWMLTVFRYGSVFLWDPFGEVEKKKYSVRFAAPSIGWQFIFLSLDRLITTVALNSLLCLWPLLLLLRS